MRPTLPRGFRQKLCGFALLVAAACSHHEPAAVPPAPPLPAEPDLQIGTMDAECQGLTAALDAYGECPNLEDDERTWAREVVEVAEQSFEAGRKAAPDAPSQRAIAIACRKAAMSIQAATERCHNGKAPKPEY